MATTEPPVNPWVTPTEPDEAPTALAFQEEEAVPPPLTGPTGPQNGVSAPSGADQLPIREAGVLAPLWVMGAHGGAGETTIAAIVPGACPAGHAWPVYRDGTRPKVLVTARSSAAGLQRAQLVAQTWAAGLVAVDLLGLAVTLDAPGRLPKTLRSQMRVAAGGFPRLWELPFHDPWRLDAVVDPATAPGPYKRLARQLQHLTAPTHL